MDIFLREQFHVIINPVCKLLIDDASEEVFLISVMISQNSMNYLNFVDVRRLNTSDIQGYHPLSPK